MKPNFIVIYTDDQRWDALSVVQKEQGAQGRFPWLQTPNLDRLAAEGTRFRNAFVVNSLCAPSRATLLTGQYGHVNGIVNNHTPFSERNVTVATLLKAAGYRTGYVGKWHMGSQRERPGFDFAASFIGQGRYQNCPFVVNGKDTPTQGWIDDVSTDYALQFVKESADKPFFLVLGFKTAHGPFEPPARHADDYATETARPVPNVGLAPIYAPERKGNPNNLNRGYFRCLRAMDDCVGKLLAGIDDNTVVIFASDNGFYLGEHSLGDKRTAYDESLRIPLIVRLPKALGKPQVTDAMALNVDIAPTVLDLAGVPVPKAMHGRSLAPVLRGKTPPDWRKAFFYTYFFEQGFTGIPTTQAVRTESAKLIRYPDHPEWVEVFDLKADPFETKNLASEPRAAALRKSLEEEFERQQKAINFTIPPFADKPGARAAAPPTGLVAPRNAWVLDWKESQRLDGTKPIRIASTPALRPNVGAWTVEASFTSEKPEGVILARGGERFGYSLHLEAGKPVFTVASESQRSQIVGTESVVGRAVVLTATITANKRLTLAVDGKEVASGPLHRFITSDPTNPMELGGDEGSFVTGAAKPHFIGTLTRVRLYSGDLKP